MLRYLILGFLRRGESRHGYELITEYRARTMVRANTGSFYRELRRLERSGLVENGVNPPEADQRRIPYQITDIGRGEFDQWLATPMGGGGEIAGWVLFMDRVPAGVRDRVLDDCQGELWLQNKALTHAREMALNHRQPGGPAERFDPLPALIARQMKHASAELEFLEDLRLEFRAWLSSQRGDSKQKAEAPTVPPARPKRKKGVPHT